MSAVAWLLVPEEADPARARVRALLLERSVCSAQHTWHQTPTQVDSRANTVMRSCDKEPASPLICSLAGAYALPK